MKVLPMLDRAAYDSFRARVDLAMGYPRAASPADRKGRAPWVPLAQSVTQSSVGYVLHPLTQAIGALILPEVEPVLSAAERLLLVPLDAVWIITAGPAQAGQGVGQAEVKLK